jgi:hypothetical protein
MNLPSLFAGLALSGVAALPLAAEAGGPPPWAGVSHQARYHYIYYPAYEIYYAPHSRYWYWREGGYWRHAYGLPASFARITLDGIQITLGSHLPYHYHHHVVRHYPAPHYRAPAPWRHPGAHGHGYRDRDHDHDRSHRYGHSPRGPSGGPGHYRGPGHFESHGPGSQRHERRGDRHHGGGRESRRDERHPGRRDGR